MATEKPRISITVESKYLDWIDEQIKEKIFANRSHGFEYAVQQLIESEEIGTGRGIQRRSKKLQ
jgi:Arc/MetJ-type ribon-helix-helix transcriptional regulator